MPGSNRAPTPKGRLHVNHDQPDLASSTSEQFPPSDPWRQGLGRGQLLYLPESYYFNEAIWQKASGQQDYDYKLEAFVQRVIEVTVREVARWADRYWAECTFDEGARRNTSQHEANLPSDRRGNRAAVDEIFAWFRQHKAPITQLNKARLILYQGDSFLYRQGDEVPGLLGLSQHQAEELADVWIQYDLPRDLYFSAREVRTVIEPTVKFGSVVRQLKSYTPLEWKHRDASAVTDMSVPAEEERIRRFVNSCRDITESLLLRITELREPGRTLGQN
jgi:hypothetical protein